MKFLGFLVGLALGAGAVAAFAFNPFKAEPVGSDVVLSQMQGEIAACGMPEAVITTTPVPPFNLGNYRNFERHRRELIADAKILVVGDSLARNWPEEKFANHGIKGAVFRAGISGDRTQNILWRLDNMGFEQMSPDLVVLVAGVNNLSAGDTVCATDLGVAATVEKVGKLFPNAKILLPAISGKGEAFLSRDADRRKINALLAERYAGDDAVTFVDVTEEMMCGQQGNLTMWQQLANQWGAAKPNCAFYQQDWLHWTPAAYELILARM